MLNEIDLEIGEDISEHVRSRNSVREGIAEPASMIIDSS
jgi:hypothetical protein